MKFKILVLCFMIVRCSAKIELYNNRNLSEMAIGMVENCYCLRVVKSFHSVCAALSEISRGFRASGTLSILNIENKRSTNFSEFLMEIHRLQLQTCIFNQSKLFFEFVEANLKGSVAVTALIFHHPDELIPKVCVRIKARCLQLAKSS